jgi:hypothetical protein
MITTEEKVIIGLLLLGILVSLSLSSYSLIIVDPKGDKGVAGSCACSPEDGPSGIPGVIGHRGEHGYVIDGEGVKTAFNVLMNSDGLHFKGQFEILPISNPEALKFQGILNVNSAGSILSEMNADPSITYITIFPESDETKVSWYSSTDVISSIHPILITFPVFSRKPVAPSNGQPLD